MQVSKEEAFKDKIIKAVNNTNTKLESVKREITLQMSLLEESNHHYVNRVIPELFENEVLPLLSGIKAFDHKFLENESYYYKNQPIYKLFVNYAFSLMHSMYPSYSMTLDEFHKAMAFDRFVMQLAVDIYTVFDAELVKREKNLK